MLSSSEESEDHCEPTVKMCKCYKCTICRKYVCERYYDWNMDACKECWSKKMNENNDYHCRRCDWVNTCTPYICNKNWEKCYKCGYNNHKSVMIKHKCPLLF
jgi:hypothetical protein